MFGFLDMMDNYEDRKVDRNDIKGGYISTARVTDSIEPYETAVRHVNYNSDRLVIVEMYDDIDDAKLGHEKWVGMFSKKKLPDQIMDVSTSEICSYLNDNGWVGDAHLNQPVEETPMNKGQRPIAKKQTFGLLVEMGFLAPCREGDYKPDFAIEFEKKEAEENAKIRQDLIDEGYMLPFEEPTDD